MHSVWQAYIRDANGDILPGASVTVRVQATNAIATIYADKAGTSPLANPFTADASGMARFYALPNTYKITATSGGFTGELVNVELALAREGLTDADAQFDFVPEAPIDGAAYARKDGAWVAGVGATNLGYTASPTDGTVTSDTGTDATIPAGDTVNASLMLPADKSKLDGIEAGAQVNAVTSVNGQTGAVSLTAASVGAQPFDADLEAIAGLSGTSGLARKTAANTWVLDTATYLTGNQSISITGDATGSGTTSIPITISNSGVTSGTYPKVTVNAKGIVTNGAALLATDIPPLDWSKITTGRPTTLSGYGITDAQPVDATLTAMAGVATAADRIIYFTGVDVSAAATLTAFGRSLIDDADAAAARTTLGLGTAATTTVTTSKSDTTAGRVLKVGDFGIGGDMPILSDVDLNNATIGGMYLGPLDAINRPTGWGTSRLSLIVADDTSSYGAQIAIGAFGADTGRMAVRGRLGTYGSWLEVYTTGNVDAVAWTTPTLSNGWTASATYGIQYRVVMGVLYISGVITAGTKTNGTAVFTLPTGARPAAARAAHVGALESGADAGAHVTISTAGVVAVQNINASHNNVVINAVVRLT